MHDPRAHHGKAVCRDAADADGFGAEGRDVRGEVGADLDAIQKQAARVARRAVLRCREQRRPDQQVRSDLERRGGVDPREDDLEPASLQHAA